MIRFFCRSCWFKIRLEDDCVGKKVKCPKCGEANYVPAAGIQPPKKKRSRRSARQDEEAVSDSGEIDLSVSATLDAGAAPSSRMYAPLSEHPLSQPTRDLAKGPPLELKMPPLGDLGVPPAKAEAAGRDLASRRARKEAAPSRRVREELSKYAKEAAPRRRDAAGREMPRRVRGLQAAAIFAAAAAVVAAAGVVLWLSVRDTWERDHADQIVALAEQAKSLMADKRFQAAIDKYEEIFQLVGGRKVQDPDLLAVIRQSEHELETAKVSLDLQAAAEEAARRAKALHERRRSSALAALGQARAAAAGGQFKQAVASYQRAIDLVAKSPLPADEPLLKQARQEQQDARKRWEQTTETGLADMAAKAQVALDAGKLDEAENQCLAAIHLAENHEVQTDKTRHILALARGLLLKIRTQKQREALRRKEAQDQARQEAERRRIRRANQMHALWQPFYAAAEQIYRQATPADAPVDKAKSFLASLSAAYAQLPANDSSRRAKAARESAGQVLASMQSYVKCHEDLAGTGAVAPGAADDPLLKAREAQRRLLRAKLRQDIEAFVSDYADLVKSSGKSIAYIPAALLQAGRAVQRTREQCAWCRGTGYMPCPDCIAKGLPTGKAQCPRCAGKGYLTCPTCAGAGSALCTRCKGRGKIWAGTRRVGRGSVRDIYRPCSRCNGTGYTHRVSGGLRPGRCPGCGANLPKGTVPCRTCHRTGRYGICPSCKGSKKAPCTHCDAYKKLPPTSQPAP